MFSPGKGVKLTKRLIDPLPLPKEGEQVYRDVELPGLILRVTPTRKAFVIEKRFNGRLLKLTLGRYGPMTLAKARERGRDRLHQILKGEDPSQEKKDLTFGQFEQLYLERYAKPRKKSVRHDQAMFKHHLAKWRARKLGSLTRQEIATLHNQIGKTYPYQANRLLALVRRMFNLARTWGIYKGDNPATGIEMFKEQKRGRFILPEELSRLLEAIQAEPNIYIRTAFMVCLLTGARKQEVLTMKWEHLNFKEASWRIPESKADRPHLVPFPTSLGTILRELARQMDNPYVFPNRNGQGHLANLSKAWKRVCDKANLVEIRIHDLRRTLGSWLAASGASLTLIGKVLNHSNVSTTQLYARLDLDPVRTALNQNAEKMLPSGFGSLSSVG